MDDRQFAQPPSDSLWGFQFDDDSSPMSLGPRPPPPDSRTLVTSVEGTVLTPRSDEDLDECIAVWQQSLQAQSEKDPARASKPQPPLYSHFTVRAEAQQHGTTFGPVLLINVGDEIFKTTAGTLRRAPFFDSMLRHAEGGHIGSTVDAEGRLFVDRSGELFAYVLVYLQSGHWLLQDKAGDARFVDALRDEAGFYGLDAGKDRLPVPRISEYATLWQFQEDTAIYVDCLEQTIREDPDHQGLFRLCKYSGGLPLDQQTGTKRFKATSHSLQAVIAYFAMRGFRLQHVVEGSMITHTTSADGQNRTGQGVQYMLSRTTLATCVPDRQVQTPLQLYP